jgi:hypothetical protein
VTRRNIHQILFLTGRRDYDPRAIAGLFLHVGQSTSI